MEETLTGGLRGAAAWLFTALAALSLQAQGPAFKKLAVEEYRDKVYGSWLGQCIGNIYGLPHENRYIEEPGIAAFPYGYRRNLEALKRTNGVFSDDDTDIEYMYLLAMEEHGPEPALADLAAMWKYHVRNRVWLANRAAVAAINHGFTPPITGNRELNPHWFQIDPQLINEIWAVTAPGMVRYAAAKSGWAARIMDDGWGIEPTIYYGAMYAAAFFESDVQKLIDIGVASLPADSRFSGTVADMRALVRKHPADWRAARQEMAEKYFHLEPPATKTIWNANLNAAAGVLALLYGKGDFQKTLDLSCAMGFDADNQAATLAGLLGVILGREGLPDELLFPVPEFGWSEPFNDFYKNVTRYDMPDAGLRDMADRMAEQGRRIILDHGGKEVSERGGEYYLVDTEAAFVAPVEFPSGPGPYIETGLEVDHEFAVFGGEPPYQWNVQSGNVPDGLQFQDGRLSGQAALPGVFPIALQLVDGRGKALTRGVSLVVRGPNLASAAERVLASVRKTDSDRRDEMWLTVPRSLYADEVDVIRDGKHLGDGSTFYSIEGHGRPKRDFFGYQWREAQVIGLLGYHTGSVEENGGWFTSLQVEYLHSNGSWKPVHGLLISPPLPPGNLPFNKPHFVEYLLAFRPVETTAIRIAGDAGGTEHWRSQRAFFTSISELTAHGPLPRYELLNR